MEQLTFARSFLFGLMIELEADIKEIQMRLVEGGAGDLVEGTVEDLVEGGAGRGEGAGGVF